MIFVFISTIVSCLFYDIINLRDSIKKFQHLVKNYKSTFLDATLNDIQKQSILLKNSINQFKSLVFVILKVIFIITPIICLFFFGIRPEDFLKLGFILISIIALFVYILIKILIDKLFNIRQDNS